MISVDNTEYIGCTRKKNGWKWYKVNVKEEDKKEIIGLSALVMTLLTMSWKDSCVLRTGTAKPVCFLVHARIKLLVAKSSCTSQAAYGSGERKVHAPIKELF